MQRYIVFLLGLREFKKTAEKTCMCVFFSPFFSKGFNLILIHSETRTEKEREREKNVDKEGNEN